MNVITMPKRHYTEFHEIANVVPLMSEEALQELAASIKTNGLRDPIVIFEGKILDGRNRSKACAIVEVTPTYEEFKGADPVEYVIDKNIRRRHLSTDQRAMAAAEIANLKATEFKGNQWSGPNGPQHISAEEAGKLVNVGRTHVVAAMTVKRDGSAALKNAVSTGQVPVRKAAKVAKNFSKSEQMDALKDLPSGTVSTNSKPKLIPKPKSNGVRSVPIDELESELRPIIRELTKQGKTHAATVSIAEIAYLAGKLKKLLDKWTEGEKAE